MTRTLIAKSTVSEKEVVVCSDVEASEYHQVFGELSLDDEEETYVKDELGDDFELSVVEDY